MSAEQFGIYVFLLCEQWESGPIPDTDEDIVRYSRTTPSNARLVLEQCFNLTDDGWINPELAEIKEEQVAKRRKRSRAGAKGGAKKAANLVAMLEKDSSKALARERGRGEKDTNYSGDFERWWEGYPRKVGKGEAFKRWKVRLKNGATVEKLTHARDRYVEYVEALETEMIYIKQGDTFLAPTGGWTDKWEIPQRHPKSDQRPASDYG